MNQGVCVHSMWWWDDAMSDKELDAAHGMKAMVARLDVGWENLQPTPTAGAWNWTYIARLDHFMDGARQRGMKVMLTFGWPPGWASYNGNGSQYRPADVAFKSYATAAAFLADRYEPTLHSLELWNEPNFSPASDGPWRGGTAADYVRLVKAAYGPVKGAAPSVRVAVGALSFSDFDYLKQMYAAGLKGSFDMLTVHPYCENRSPDDRRRPGEEKWAFLPGLKKVREVMAANGDGGKPLAASEYGWTTGSEAPSNYRVSVTDQVAYTLRARTLMAQMGLEAAILYQLRVVDGNVEGMDGGWAAMGATFVPRSLYKALAA